MGIPEPLSTMVTELSAWIETLISFARPAIASSTELSTTSYTRWWRPRSPTSPMYMCGRLRTASRPSSTLIASVPYSSAPFPLAGRRVFSAVSRGFPRSFSERFRRVGEPWGCSRRMRPKQPLRRGTTYGNNSRKKRRNGPVFHLHEGRVRPRRRLEEPPIRRGEDRLRVERAQVREEIAVLLGVELGRDVVEQEERRPAERRPEVLDLGDLERKHHRALLPLAPEGARALPVEREEELVHVRPGRRVALLAIALDAERQDLREPAGELLLRPLGAHPRRGPVREPRLRRPRPRDLRERRCDARRELADEV